MEKFPFCMATQHPDNAKSPYWLKHSAFIDTRSEIEEAYRCFSELKIPEYMWDWEGKHVDESVTERLLEKYSDFFLKNQLGNQEYLTFRVPNPWEEGGYKLARAFVNIISSNDLACKFELKTPPIYQAILPMTQNAEQLFWMRKKYRQLASAIAKTELHPTSNHISGPSDLDWIPLVETTQAMTESSSIFLKYMNLCKKANFPKLEYLRPFIARSDPALNSGFIAATLSASVCLSECEKFTQESSIPTYPIIGVGCLPFRGGFTPYSIDVFFKQYAGVVTPTVQSSYRYDYPTLSVKKSIEKLRIKKIKKSSILSPSAKKEQLRLIQISSDNYQLTLEQITELVNIISKFVPSRRERKQHIGLFGYSRKVGKSSLPRAISFTASLYSIGVPPEIIGISNTIAQIKSEGLYSCLEDSTPSLIPCLKSVMPFVNFRNLKYLSTKSKWASAFKSIINDVESIEEKFAINCDPVDIISQEHQNLTSSILKSGLKGLKSTTSKIEESAILRKSIG